MNDDDISKLAAKMTESLATKEDIKELKTEVKELKVELKTDFKRLEDKVDHILKYAENIDEVVDNHGKRLTKVENHLGLPTPTNN